MEHPSQLHSGARLAAAAASHSQKAQGLQAEESHHDVPRGSVLHRDPQFSHTRTQFQLQ